MIATNLCEWLYVLIEETQHDILKSVSKRNKTLSVLDSQFIYSHTFQATSQLYQAKFNCLASNIMEPILTKSEPYLAPCTVEYSLLSAVILGLMWKNVCGNEALSGMSNKVLMIIIVNHRNLMKIYISFISGHKCISFNLFLLNTFITYIIYKVGLKYRITNSFSLIRTWQKMSFTNCYFIFVYFLVLYVKVFSWQRNFYLLFS